MQNKFSIPPPKRQTKTSYLIMKFAPKALCHQCATFVEETGLSEDVLAALFDAEVRFASVPVMILRRTSWL